MMFQDNTQTIKLIKNGRRSSGKRTRHFDIQLFCAKDYVDGKEVTMQCYPAEEMIADCMSKPLAGSGFKSNREKILNLPSLQ